MKRTKFGGPGAITRQEFIRRVSTVGIAAATTGGLAIVGAPTARAAKPPTTGGGKPTKPPTTTSGFTMTLGGPNAPSKISGSVAVAKNDPRVAFRGGATKTREVWPNDVLAMGIAMYGGDWAAGFEVDFMYDGRMLETYELASRKIVTPIFDSVLGATDKSTPDDWTLRYRLLDFGTRASRRVRLQLNNYMGLRIESGSTIMAVQAPKGPRTIFLGDSFTEGTAGAYPSGSCYGGYVITAGLTAGLDAWPSGVGATGIVNDYGGLDGRRKFRDRLSTDVIPFAPDVVVIAGGLNDSELVADGTVTPSQYRAEYDALIEAIRTNLPTARIVVLGPFCPGSPTSYRGVTEIRDLNQAAARAAGVPFIDVFYFTDANRSGYVSRDNFHLNAAGHEYLGKKLGADLIQVLQ
jgi:lysophospholipase L1-like esterase